VQWRRVRADRLRSSVPVLAIGSGVKRPTASSAADLALAPGARPHVPVDRRAPVEEFEQIAPQIPVFRVATEQAAGRAAR